MAQLAFTPETEQIASTPTGVPWVNALWQAMVRDPMGGFGSPGTAVVTNPEHALFQTLKATMPKVAAALERMPTNVTFGNATPEIMKTLGTPGAWGRTTSIGPKDLSILVSNAAPVPQSTLTHEALHSLYANKAMQGGKSALELTHGAMSPPTSLPMLTKGQDLSYLQKLLDFYKGDVPHMNIETMTNNALKAGGQPWVRRKL